MVVEYPDSEPAFRDLYECLMKVDYDYEEDVINLFEKRLLHGGAKTVDIIQQLIHCLKSFLILDPSGKLGDKLSEKIKKYLKNREDFLKDLIHKIFEDPDSELQSDLKKDSKQFIHLNLDMDPEFYFLTCQEQLKLNQIWQPESKNRHHNGLLIESREGGRDLMTSILDRNQTSSFIEAFQKYLSNRLLGSFDFDSEVEIGFVEVLKKRFGEIYLSKCEVMLRDISESKRFMSGLQQQQQQQLLQQEKEGFEVPLRVLLVSYLFWPKLTLQQVFKIPDFIQKEITNFEEKYQKLKANRKLKFIHDLGTVHLEFKYDSGLVKDFHVSPFLASIILLFRQQSIWHLDDLSRLFEVDVLVMRQKLGFWVRQSVLKQLENEEYEILKNDVNENSSSTKEIIEESHPLNDASNESSGDSKMEVYWTFIVGMLTNLGTLPLSRIQQMLTLFVQQPKYDCQESELRDFLQLKVRHNLLESTSGGYKLK